MDFLKWIDENSEPADMLNFRPPRPRIACKDGFNISIQAGEAIYSDPRTPLEKMEDYTAYELGFPSELDELLVPYAEEAGTTETVFAYVPKEVVTELIEKHGGFDEEASEMLLAERRAKAEEA